MKKTFQLAQEGKKPDRLLEATKHEIRKYIKRERRRTLPEGVDYWDFDCRFGATQDDAAVAHQGGGTRFYVEILVKHGHRKAREQGEAATAPD